MILARAQRSTAPLDAVVCELAELLWRSLTVRAPIRRGHAARTPRQHPAKEKAMPMLDDYIPTGALDPDAERILMESLPESSPR